MRICKVQIEHDVIDDLKVKNVNVDCFKINWQHQPLTLLHRNLTVL